MELGKYLYSLLLFLVLLLPIGCVRPTTDTTVSEPVSSPVAPLSLDSLGQVHSDSVRVLGGPKTLYLQGKKIKLRRGATLVIQQGSGNAATTVTKAKNSTVVIGEGGTAADNRKTGNKAQGGVALGNDNAAQGSQKVQEAGWPWYVWAALAGAVFYALLKVKPYLGL